MSAQRRISRATVCTAYVVAGEHDLESSDVEWLAKAFADVRAAEREACARLALAHEEWANDPGRLEESERRLIVGAVQTVAREIRSRRSGDATRRVTEETSGGETSPTSQETGGGRPKGTGYRLPTSQPVASEEAGAFTPCDRPYPDCPLCNGTGDRRATRGAAK